MGWAAAHSTETGSRNVRRGSIASLWPRAAHFRSSPNSDFVSVRRHVSNVPRADVALLFNCFVGARGLREQFWGQRLSCLRLMTNSNFVGWTTGRSAGFSPLRIRPA